MEEEIYKEFIIELYKNPLNFGRIEKADYHAELYNTTCGDIVELFIKVKGGKVIDAKFMGKGCAISQASASLFTGHLIGRKTSDLPRISNEEVLGLLKIDLSKNPTRLKCALLVLDTLKKALKGQ